MRLGDIIARAGRSLGQAKARTLLTSLAIGVGAFTLTLALAAGNGSRHYIDSLVATNANTKQLTVLAGGLGNQPDNSQPQEFGSRSAKVKQQTLDQADLTQLKQISGVKSVQPNYQVQSQYVTRSGQKKYTVPAVADGSNGLKIKLVAGQVTGDQVKPGHVIIPNNFLDPLGFKTATQALGQTVTINYLRPGNSLNPLGQTKSIDYQVQAVEIKPDNALNYQPKFTLNAQDLKAVYDFERSGTPGYGQFVSASVEVNDATDVAAVEQAVKDRGYTAFSAQEIQKTLFQFINVVEYGVAGFGGLAILAAIFGIINTQYISVLERTRQIGLMKALGMRRFDVLRLFLFEAAWIGFLGGVIGAGLAGLTGWAVNPFISQQLDLGSTQLLLFDWLPVVGLIAGLVIIAMLAGFFPARKAARLDPIEALRTE